jgi:putative nucleotidyltransferase-like protein
MEESILKSAAAIMALDATAAKVVEALERHQIPAILLKGPALTRWLYDRRIERSYGDVDLLVSPDDFDAAAQVLRCLGYQQPILPRRPGLISATANSNARHFRHRSRGSADVDLHRGFCWRTMDPHATWRVLRKHTETLTVGGRDVLVLAPSALAVVIALHAAQHGPASRPRDDLDRAVRQFDEAVWRLAASLAAQLVAEEPFAAGLRLVPPGQQLADRLGLTASVAVEVALLRSGDSRALPLHQLSAEPSLLRRFTSLCGMLVPSAEYVRTGYPIANRGGLFLIYAYLYRAVKLLRQLPRARRVVKGARSSAPRPRGRGIGRNSGA